MFRSPLAKAACLLVACCLLLPALASAEPPRRGQGLSPVGEKAALWHVVSELWTRIRAIWQEEGSSLDPFGNPKPQEGSSLDPFGGTSPPPTPAGQ